VKISRKVVSPLVFLLAVSLVEAPFAAHAHAGMIPTSQAVADLSRAQNLAKLDEFIGRQEVQAQLIKNGVTPREASQRIASLSDFELQKMAGNVETAPAGAEVVVIGVTTLLLIIIIILLVRR
jgi:hypothetical protein